MKINFKKTDLLLIPNLLSFFRVLLIPIIIMSYIKYNNTILTVGIITLSGVTDILDGYIARHYNMISDIGKIIDPMADKLTQASILACLAFKFPIILIILITLIIKETTTLITGFLGIKNSNRVDSAKWHGKLTTCFIYTVVVIHIIWNTIPSIISLILIAMCEIMMIISFILYTKINIKKIKE